LAAHNAAPRLVALRARGGDVHARSVRAGASVAGLTASLRVCTCVPGVAACAAAAAACREAARARLLVSGVSCATDACVSKSPVSCAMVLAVCCLQVAVCARESSGCA
jgi:hypothetical protein